MITMIAAAAENNALGKDNQLLWHLPDDFKRFKALTTGHHIIMGRKTFESFPKPLPNRVHVVITRQTDYRPEGIITANSINEAIEKCPNSEEIFIIGGGEIYSQALHLSDKVELTRVHQSFEADAFFPELDPSDWELTFSENHPEDERHKISFTFETYLRKR